MSDSLGPGSTFAGCRLDAVAGRGSIGIVFQATQPALQRTVALKVIASDLAADAEFRDRFRRESQLAASIDHPNVIPIYEAGEQEGTPYLMMRWVQGTNLRTMLKASERLSPDHAAGLLQPVASALAAAHARDLIHRDLKPANILVARGPDGEGEHVYVTDFGLARKSDSESIRRAGVFAGTVDYTAPERFQGGEGNAASDIYSLGCVLFETLTGHVPYSRPSMVSTIFAHAADPIPSAADEVPDVPAELDAIIAKAMAKLPEDRFASAGELAAALGQVLEPSDAAERAVAPEDALRDTAETVAPTVMTEAASAQMAPAVTRTEPAVAPIEPAVTRTEPAVEPIQPAVTRTEPAVEPIQPAVTRTGPAVARTGGRSRFIWLATLVLLSLVGVLIATFSDVRSTSGQSLATSPYSPATSSKRVTIQGSGMTVGRTIGLAHVPGSVSIGSKNLWVSLPALGELARVNLGAGTVETFPASDRPSALAAGSRALWVAPAAASSMAQFNGDSGAQVHSAHLDGRPDAIALARNDSTVWVADSSGAISHVDVGPPRNGAPAPVIGTPAHTHPAATSLAWGEGWLWATTGTGNELLRVSLGTSGSSTTYRAAPHAVAVTTDQGVWIAGGDGRVTRFDPRRLRADADIVVAPELDAIAATDPGPWVWALSESRRTVYRLTNASKPAVTGRIVFESPPVAIAVSPHSAWIATQDRKVTEVRF